MLVVEVGKRVGLFTGGSIKTGIVKELINKRYCVFIQDFTKDEHEVDVKKLRIVRQSQWDSGV